MSKMKEYVMDQWELEASESEFMDWVVQVERRERVAALVKFVQEK